MAATYALTRATLIERPEIIIQAGVAGAIDIKLALSSVVAVKSEVVGDCGVKEGGCFRSVFDLKLLNGETRPWINAKLVNSNGILTDCVLPLVEAVTVNEISTTQDRIDYYSTNLSAQIESMEGAALHYVGLQQGIPFLQIRSLSNFIGERDKGQWQLEKAIDSLNRELQRILQTLSK
jgi:futalosine hydrolase